MIRKVVGLFASAEFARFFIVGGFAAVVNFCSRFIYSYELTFSYAVVAAYITGMVTAYILSRLFVFPASQNRPLKEMLIFTLVNVVALAQTWAISVLLYYHLLDRFGVAVHQAEIAHFVGISIPVFSSYIGHKFFTFKP